MGVLSLHKIEQHTTLHLSGLQDQFSDISQHLQVPGGRGQQMSTHGISYYASTCYLRPLERNKNMPRNRKHHMAQ